QAAEVVDASLAMLPELSSKDEYPRHAFQLALALGFRLTGNFGLPAMDDRVRSGVVDALLQVAARQPMSPDRGAAVAVALQFAPPRDQRLLQALLALAQAEARQGRGSAVVAIGGAGASGGERADV